MADRNHFDGSGVASSGTWLPVAAPTGAPVVVFVPNGFVIHDYLAAREPFLLRSQDLSSLGPATADLDIDTADLIDVSQLAPGPVLQVALHGEVEVVPRTRGISEVRVVKSILCSPTRPGAVLQEAR